MSGMRAFANHYWPALYFAGPQGRIHSPPGLGQAGRR
jgi:hypothetical protein